MIERAKIIILLVLIVQLTHCISAMTFVTSLAEVVAAKQDHFAAMEAAEVAEAVEVAEGRLAFVHVAPADPVLKSHLLMGPQLTCTCRKVGRWEGRKYLRVVSCEAAAHRPCLP